MKANLLQLVGSSIVLGLMAGAVGLHWHQLRQFDSAELPQEAGEGYVLISSGGPAPVSLPFGMSPGRVNAESQVPDTNLEMNATLEALSEIVSVLQELKDENRDLRDQIEESNRDASEMRFQLETHSRSFRPMKLGSGPAHRVEEQENHPLLPPKRR